MRTEHLHSISQHMATVIQRYTEIRAKPVEIGEFWDAVVITTADEEQSKAYEFQLQRKVLNKEVPENVPFFLYPDPPGIKIGSGGSILYSLDRLYSVRGEDMFRWRILFICAGGKSQRLPTASILGKLFLPLPFGEPTFHMLDLKLALYLPFLRCMKPGVLITCSDDIETFCLPHGDSEQELSSFAKDGFTALGTISSTSIGKNHGVYVLPTCLDTSDNACVVHSSCLRVLQKPSLELMKETGAILKDGNVCTDSIYFFDHTVSKKFLDFMRRHQKITSEIDAYGDFLQPLGSLATRDYIDNMANVLTATSTLAATREELFALLHETPLHVIVLQLSRFYHLGTMVEYVENIAPSATNSFFQELNCQPVAFSKITKPDCSSDQALLEFVKHNLHVTVMHSYIGSSVKIGQFVVLEYCQILGPADIGDHCILSNCQIGSAGANRTIMVPSHCCFHTAAVCVGEDVKFVTIAFGINDDLKKSVSVADGGAMQLKYLGLPVEHISKVFNATLDQLLTEGAESCSLWNARLFSVADSMEESFAVTSDMTCRVLDYEKYCDSLMLSHSAIYISIAEIVSCKSIEKMIEFQDNLRDIITGKLDSNKNSK